MSQEAYALLEGLAESSGRNKADVLRIGLALFGIAWEEGKKGRSMAIIENDKVVKEILLS